MQTPSLFYDEDIVTRHKKAKRFQWLVASCAFAVVGFLVVFVSDLTIKALPALTQTQILVPVSFTQKTTKSYRKAVPRTMQKLVSRVDLIGLIQVAKDHPEYLDTTQNLWLDADDALDQYLRGKTTALKERQKTLIDEMVKNDNIRQIFNTDFFTSGDSKHPEQAGILSALIGTVLTMIITIVVAFPLGVATAIYLEEFAQDNRFTQFIEVNINNLAAIPSILFGILGLAIFINVFEMPRSSPLVGGLTLALMVLPIIVVSSRAALKAVDVKIKQAGYGLGLSKWQVVRDITLPSAMPGMLTGSIISLAQAIGETAPLIMVGMVAFVPDSSWSILSPATVMPAQIFTWSGMPESLYEAKTALGILLLLGVMVGLNGFAIWLRKKLQK